jgi:hypothetical protein
MHTENHIHFTDDLVNRIGFYMWMHSKKCKLIRIGFYIAMLVSTILAFTGFLRHLVLKTSWTMMGVFLILTFIMLFAVLVIWPLVFRSKAVNSVHADVDQIVTIDEKYVNLHTKVSHQQYKWHLFDDIEEDDRYYFLFSPEVYIILDKKTFPKGGENVFREMRVPNHLLKEAARKSRKQHYLMITDKDYLTPIAGFSSLFKGKH